MAVNQTDRTEDLEDVGERKGAVVIMGGAYPEDARVRRAWHRQHASKFLMPSYKRIRRWRDRRLTSLKHGGILVTHRRASFAAPHKSRQRRR